MSHLAEVHTIYQSNASNISEMMRHAADKIEKEKDDPDCDPTVVVVAVQLTVGGNVNVYGWGETNDIHALGALVAGQHQLAKMIEDGAP